MLIHIVLTSDSYPKPSLCTYLTDVLKMSRLVQVVARISYFPLRVEIKSAKIRDTLYN